jgi:pimeloyl-ACP methyl ester carboxylesterase
MVEPDFEHDETAIGERIAAMFAELFGVDHVGPDEDFFALGGDSLLATGLTANIERVFGIVLPVSALIEAPTPAALAGIVAQDAAGTRQRCLITVAAAGDGPPIFCVHGMGGDIVQARALAEALGTRRPVFAFRALGLQDGEVPPATVQEIAANYAEEVQGSAPDGPLIIIGNCGGSFIAYEMARQLRETGRTVAGLVLVDPAGAREMAWLNRRGMAVHKEARTALAVAEKFVQRFAAEPPSTGIERRKLVTAHLHVAVGGYVPGRYAGATLLICTERSAKVLLDPAAGFPRVASALESTTIGDDHDALFSTRVGDVAAAVTLFLDRVAPLEQFPI